MTITVIVFDFSEELITSVQAFKYEAQTALLKDPVRTTQ